MKALKKYISMSLVFATALFFAFLTRYGFEQFFGVDGLVPMVVVFFVFLFFFEGSMLRRFWE